MKHGAGRNGQQEVRECVCVCVRAHVRASEVQRVWGEGGWGGVSKMSHLNIPRAAAGGYFH